MADENNELNVIELATELTIAWLNNPNNRVNADDVPSFLQKMHTTINELATGSSTEDSSAPKPQEEYTRAVTVRKSLASQDHILSMIDGKPYKTLRRHLAGHGMTPEQYRAHFNLKPDYPMVAPAYSEHRRAMAHKIGLGSKGRQAQAANQGGGATEAPKKRAPRKRKEESANAE
jgi:predicted transcriptional regulator